MRTDVTSGGNNAVDVALLFHTEQKETFFMVNTNKLIGDVSNVNNCFTVKILTVSCFAKDLKNSCGGERDKTMLSYTFVFPYLPNLL